MRDLRFAIIGAGFWAPYQLAAWQEVAGAECVAVCDIVRSQAEYLARKHGVDRIYDNAEVMFAEESLDFVDIITSPETHQSLVHLAAKHSVPAICQKPLAESLESAQAMVTTCKKAEIPLLVHENFRWQRPLRELRKVLESNCIGKVFRARLHYGNSFPVFENQPFLRDLERFMLADVGVHLMDVSRFLFGEAESLFCRTQQVNPSISGEDVATVMLAMHDGSTVTIELSYASRSEHERFPETYVFVEGAQGSVELAHDFWLRVTTSDGTHARRVPPSHYEWADPAYDLVHDSTVDCNRNLLASLRYGNQAETTAEDNLKSLQLVFASYESAETKQVVHLSDQEVSDQEVSNQEGAGEVPDQPMNTRQPMGPHLKPINHSPHVRIGINGLGNQEPD